MSEPSTFRARLKRHRVERGLTQEELGELVGYAAQTIRKIEGGQRRPSLQLALRLAQALGLGPDDQAAWMTAARAVAEAEDASASPQPLRPLTPSSGLPTYLTPFVGREQERAELGALLSQTDCRLVTVLGLGGVGKTRLVIETVRTVQNFPDGVAFVSLAPVAAPSSIVPAIAAALGFTFSGREDLLAQLLTYLRDRRVLLVLDNLEHLLDSEGETLGLLEQLLAQAPRVTVLATSRERLRLGGEWLLELGGLTVAQTGAESQRIHGPAMTLFAEYVQRVDRSFHMVDANAATIAAICDLVDGLPLGIELAAAWTRTLSLEEIAQELRQGLDTAHLASRTLPARHHSLRAVVDHSWQLLSMEERMVLRQLAVFQGSFTREAAAAVADARLLVLANLVDKSLLRRSGNGRYDLHEVIRQYANGQLREQVNELEATHNRHAAYYLHWVAEREQRLKRADQASVIIEISTEIDNIRAAWHWAAVHGLTDELGGAADALQWFFEFHSLVQEGATLFGEAVEHLRTRSAVGETVEGRRVLGRLLGYYGYLATRVGAFVQAFAALSESHTLLADGADPIGLGHTLRNQAAAAWWSGNYGEARRLIDASLAITAQTQDPHQRAMGQTVASHVAYSFGEYENAEQLFQAGLADWRALGNPRGTVWCITSCTRMLLALGKHQEAEQLLRESLALAHAADDRGGVATSVYHLGLVAMKQGDVEASVSFFREALDLLASPRDVYHIQILNELGAALWQAGDEFEAKRTFEQALVAAMGASSHYEAYRAMLGIATYHVHYGNHVVALKLTARVLEDVAGNEQALHNAAQIQSTARAHLSVDEVARIEQQARAQSLAEVVAELSLPLVHH